MPPFTPPPTTPGVPLTPPNPPPFSQLQSLNLSSNKLYRLDDLSELAQKAAGLKILDLSRNEVRAAGHQI